MGVAKSIADTPAARSTGVAQDGDSRVMRFEPLPADPAKRIYFGELYDPGRYLECLEAWKQEDGDPRVDPCTAYIERLEPLDPNRREEFGEFYDPKKYHECRSFVSPSDRQCDYLKLTRTRQPEFWPDSGIQRPRLPNPPNRDVYRWWMTARQYFEALCESEAGEFITRTITHVAGVYEIRPRNVANHYVLTDRYVMEDPYGYTEPEARNAPLTFLGPKRYAFFERPVQRERVSFRQRTEQSSDPGVLARPSPDDKVVRYYGYDRRTKNSLKKTYDTKLNSRYGYTWREIRRPKDRELGIAGGELLVLDLETNEVLGIRRGFLLAANIATSRWGKSWEYGEFCPLLSKRRGIAKDYDATFQFVSRVLVPQH